MSPSGKETFSGKLDEAAAWVEEGLRLLVHRLDPLSILPKLGEYSLGAGGKRLRPFLVRASCEALGGDPDRAIHSACAVEMIHTYSMIHDDLPAMDDDDLRRGMPTLHVAHGPQQALLAGDLLLVEAFREILRTPLGPSRSSAMAGRLASAAGPAFLVGGQYMDMYHPEETGMEWIARMIRGKTAALMRVSLELGVMASCVGDDLLQQVSTLGDRLGFLFQLTDDILDVSGCTEEMGKRVAKDSAQAKSNPVSMMGLRSAEDHSRELAEEIASGFDGLRGDWSSISGLALYLPGRRS